MQAQNVNLFMLTRASSSQQRYCEAMTSISNRFREYEYQMLGNLVDRLVTCGATITSLEGFAYSFSIPFISCEIDLLKIDTDRVAIDIELKSESVSEERIKKQLLRNRRYVSTVADKVYCFTVVRDETELLVFALEEEELRQVRVNDIVAIIQNLKEPLCENYGNLFRPADYLVSPINSPERFLEQKYILTQQQEEIKKQIVEQLMTERKCVLAITGSAGTGKTLLLYDIAYELSKTSRVCIIHCGKNATGQEYLQSHWDNVVFPYVGKLWWYTDQIAKADCIFVDEAHRLFEETYNFIQNIVSKQNKKVVYTYDPVQVLSKSEEIYNASSKIVEMLTRPTYSLTTKIRTNPNVASFIGHVFQPHLGKGKHDYKDITILAAKNVEESKKIIEYYTRVLGYTHINYTPSVHYRSVWNEFNTYPCSHEVIGQEFDNVVVVMDENFRIKEGKIVCCEHPNPNYLYGKMLYQALSRTRIKLCIIVRNNKELLEYLLRIKNEIYE